ncbi:hypothetical protein ABL78_2945 [Leptomonas seymouri]|uniref:SKP1 component dimerisation domain-containing protein n=1 Tax=Leptomonas seymouri TaxID=5684 RepID=A0A0N1PF05_LEPSE|nr:hypothetical protein ABL78_2945 [Leptomonas seymouri]|eukprot:KPI87954.1 hypothetical protein ABL78_2945 [Leptomonas seymouri]
MAQSSLLSPSAFCVNAPGGQTLILIASDGVRVSVNRAIATEASYVLRDLLDGQDLVSNPSYNIDGIAGGLLGEAGELSRSMPVASTTMTVHDLESLFEGVAPSPTASQNALASNGKAAVPELMDFFSVAPPAVTPSSSIVDASTSQQALAAASSTSNAGDTSADNILASLWDPQPKSASTSTKKIGSTAKARASTNVPPLRPPSPAAPPQPPAEVELPFPYFTGDILERVCRHMSYRFRMSSFGTEDGCYRVYLVKTRVLPRPMTLPLVEYLDAKDRHFLSDWDELITIQMVKAATLLNYEELLQLASAKLASYLMDRDLESVRTFLGVECDFDPAEEAELKKEQAMDLRR